MIAGRPIGRPEDGGGGGGEGGIRTRDGLPHTAFPVRRPRPLGDLSGSGPIRRRRAGRWRWSGGEGGIRTHGAFAHRFSRAAPSTTRTPLRGRGYQRVGLGRQAPGGGVGRRWRGSAVELRPQLGGVVRRMPRHDLQPPRRARVPRPAGGRSRRRRRPGRAGRTRAPSTSRLEQRTDAHRRTARRREDRHARQEGRAERAAASRSAAMTACAVGSPLPRTRSAPRATIASSMTATAPTGALPRSAACGGLGQGRAHEQLVVHVAAS